MSDESPASATGPRRARRGPFIWAGIVLAGLGAWFVLAGGGLPLRLTVVHPQRGPAIEAVYATGIVEPSVMLPIAPRSMGYLKTLEVDEGVAVRRNQVLARLDATDLQGSVDELVAQERYAHGQYERIEAIVRRRLAAVAELDRARSDWHASRAALDRARAQLDFMTLRSPADGLIIRRDGEIGQFIPAGQALFYLATTAPLRVTADVDEEDAPRVRSGQAVLLRAAALPGMMFEGVLDEITPKGDPVTRSYRVRIRLAAPRDFRIGMTVDANIIVDKKDNAWLIPAAAVADGAVWTIREGRLHRQNIRTGVAGDQRVEVIAGLDATAAVVAEPAETLREGRRAWIRRP